MFGMVILITMYRVEQKIHGHTYVYEVTSYWDAEKRQARQKRVYIGRKDLKTGEVVDTKRASSKPVESLSFGTTCLLKHISKQIQLTEVLAKIFPEQYKQLLYLASFKVATGEPFYLYSYWHETQFLPPEFSLEPQRISELLASLGGDDKTIERFFSAWIEQNNKGSAVMFDITSISSYSENNNLLEYGYNRDKEQIPQINLGVISRHSENDNLPLVYRIYPGSVNDVVTLSNITRMIKEYGLELDSFVLDRGFYSQENLSQMHKSHLKWLIPLPFRLLLTKDLLVQVEEEIDSPLNAFSYNNAQIYNHTKRKIHIKNIPCMAHIYLDKPRQVREEEALMQKIVDFETLFPKKLFKSLKHAKEYLDETLKSQKRFFSIRKTKERFCLQRNLQEINSERRLLGKFVICTNNPSYSREQVLTLYRSKDGIEKIFLSFKQELGDRRNRTKSEATMRGSIFISFLALIITTHISSTMADNDLFRKFSKSELLKSLNKLKVFRLANEQCLLSEITARQKEIFLAFNVKKFSDPSYKSTEF